MRKHIPFAFVMLFLWSISCNEETPVARPDSSRITITDIHHEPGVNALLSKIKTGSANGRVSSLEVDGAFFKYEDLDSGILNYTFSLPDDSPDYFENLVLSKYDDGFYGYIYRYIPDKIQPTPESFRGMIQQFNLEGRQIGEFSVPFSSDTITTSGRTQLINQCVQSIEQVCVTTYEIRTVTDYPCHCQYDRKTVVGQVCTFSFNRGWCDDMTGIPPAGGGGTYVGMGDGPSPRSGSGGYNGTVKPVKKNPIVVAPGNDLYVGDKCVACIENQLKDPCLKAVAKKVLNPAIASSYNKLIQDIFNKSDKVNLIIREGDAEDMKIPKKKGANGWTEPVESHNGIVDIIIELNTEKLNSNVSQEYIASTIYHEAFHAIVHYFDKDKWFFANTPTDDHIAIFYTYLDLIASGLQNAYPSLTLREAQGLVLKGMMDYKKEWGVLYDKILQKKNITEDQLRDIVRRHSSKISGTFCN
jgi:hypothetical protein